MSPSKHQMTYYYDLKFVLPEHGSYFFPYRRGSCFPTVMDILQEIFDLDDPGAQEPTRRWGLDWLWAG